MTPGLALFLLTGGAVSVRWGTHPAGWPEDSSSFHRWHSQPPPLASWGLGQLRLSGALSLARTSQASWSPAQKHRALNKHFCRGSVPWGGREDETPGIALASGATLVLQSKPGSGIWVRYPAGREADHTHPGQFSAVCNYTFTCIIRRPLHFKAVVILIFTTSGKKRVQLSLIIRHLHKVTSRLHAFPLVQISVLLVFPLLTYNPVAAGHSK